MRRDDAYYESLGRAVDRYEALIDGRALFSELSRFIREEFKSGIAKRLALEKLNRWLGYVQGVLITHGITTVEAERDWTRPLFKALDGCMLAVDWEEAFRQLARSALVGGCSVVAADDTVSLQNDRAEHLANAIREHRSAKADDRCIEDDDRLYEALGDGITCDRHVGDKAAMLANCARFIERRCEGGHWPTYVELEERLKQAEERAGRACYSVGCTSPVLVVSHRSAGYCVKHRIRPA